MRKTLILCAALLASVSAPAFAEKKYGPGVGDTEILMGQTMPYSGPASAYGVIGKTAEERAETRMWTRRIDLNIIEPLTNGFRYAEGLGLFKDRIPTIPEAAPGLKKVAQHNLAWLDRQLEGKQFIAGSRFTLADILLYAFLDFASGVGQPIPADLKNVTAWFERVKARPSAAATAG